MRNHHQSTTSTLKSRIDSAIFEISIAEVRFDVSGSIVGVRRLSTIDVSLSISFNSINSNRKTLIAQTKFENSFPNANVDTVIVFRRRNNLARQCISGLAADSRERRWTNGRWPSRKWTTEETKKKRLRERPAVEGTSTLLPIIPSHSK